MTPNTDSSTPQHEGDTRKLKAVRILRRGTSTTRSRQASRLAERVGGMWTVGVLILLILIFGFVAPEFYSQANWLATSEYAVEFMLLALAETFVIITGGIDLSVGAMLGLSSMSSAVLMSDLMGSGNGSIPIVIGGIVLALIVGAAVGLLNGLLITKLRVAPFIVTLGTLGMATGATYLLNNGEEVATVPSQVADIGNTVIGGWVAVPVLITAVLCLACWLVLSRTRFGLRTYAIGSNPVAAQRAGINVNRHLVVVYVIAGFLSGVAGLMVMSRFASASPLAGANDNLSAIAAVVIGGASLFGGRGTVLGSIVGTFVISILVTGLILAHVQTFWQQVAVGAILIAAVTADQIRMRLQQR
jgi:ribose transport system permease protein